MQVTFKTLKQISFKLECYEDETVASVKAKIENERGDEFPANSQKLIHSGKIMEDSKLLKDYKVSEKGFIVVMVTTKGKVGTETPKSEPTPEKESQPDSKPVDPIPETPKPTENPPTTEIPTEETSKPSETVPLTTPAVQPSDQPSDPPSAAPEEAEDDFGNALLTGSDFEACVERIMAMGFPREEVHQAMRRSYNNPDRAVEYLINRDAGDIDGDEIVELDDESDTRLDNAYGDNEHEAEMVNELFEEADESEDAERIIHELLEGTLPQEQSSEESAPTESQLQQPPETQPPPVAPAVPATPPAVTPQAPSAGGADPFRELITQPQFLQMRQMLRRNPQLLAQLMEQLYRTNPELFQVIRNNQERFLAYLNETSGDTGGLPEMEVQPPVGGVSEAQDPFSGAGGTGNAIRMTPDERQAIERLKALGFPEMMVIQAYFACDKNEDAAANFLLSEAFGDDD